MGGGGGTSAQVLWGALGTRTNLRMGWADRYTPVWAGQSRDGEHFSVFCSLTSVVSWWKTTLVDRSVAKPTCGSFARLLWQ